MPKPEIVRCETHKNYRGRSTPNQPCLDCLRVYFERRANTHEEGDSECVSYDDMALLIRTFQSATAATATEPHPVVRPVAHMEWHRSKR